MRKERKRYFFRLLFHVVCRDKRDEIQNDGDDRRNDRDLVTAAREGKDQLENAEDQTDQNNGPRAHDLCCVLCGRQKKVRRQQGHRHAQPGHGAAARDRADRSQNGQDDLKNTKYPQHFLTVGHHSDPSDELV